MEVCRLLNIEYPKVLIWHDVLEFKTFVERAHPAFRLSHSPTTVKTYIPSSLTKLADLIDYSRFKEMCETQAPVQSLIYLQNQISEVVNHDDPNETQLFRSLLTHLLINSSPISTIPSAIETESPRNNYARDAKPQIDSSLLKISTGNNSDQLGHPGRLQSGLGSVHISSEPLPDLSSQNRTDTKIQTSEDPYERKLHPTENSPSQECFVQRTKTFEAILEFVADDVKQPAGSLLELVDVDADLL